MLCTFSIFMFYLLFLFLISKASNVKWRFGPLHKGSRAWHKIFAPKSETGTLLEFISIRANFNPQENLQITNIVAENLQEFLADYF